ncbi:phospholipase A2-like [Chrysoperla carnea]|uniref:phospholipase A2-like n=1 Tax=Chrysoperla carnea TaxID=189513 RepID=UPI001D05EB40|nr:phospholipase A2-like [Chrysoperla carnea]
MSNLLFSSVIIVAICFQVSVSWVVQTHNSNNDMTNEITDEDGNPIGEQRLSLIVPGTKWCGSGNISENYEDLGKFKETDKCCRAHDYCDDIIEAGETKYNLTNNSFYTRLNCKCDEEFYNCLRGTDSYVSNHVGGIYFNVLGTKCYREDYPIVKCVKKERKRCVEYEFDENGEKLHQWFDVPFY